MGPHFGSWGITFELVAGVAKSGCGSRNTVQRYQFFSKMQLNKLPTAAPSHCFCFKQSKCGMCSCQLQQQQLQQLWRPLHSSHQNPDHFRSQKWACRKHIRIRVCFSIDSLSLRPVGGRSAIGRVQSQAYIVKATEKNWKTKPQVSRLSRLLLRLKGCGLPARCARVVGMPLLTCDDRLRDLSGWFKLQQMSATEHFHLKSLSWPFLVQAHVHFILYCLCWTLDTSVCSLLLVQMNICTAKPTEVCG
jgi:hypothetical protein